MDWIHNNYGEVYWYWWILLIALIVIPIIVVWVNVYNNNRENTVKILKQMGYRDIDDIEIFCDSIGQNLGNFILSKGLRKQYELFSEGKSSDFMKEAKNKKDKDDSESSGMSTGIAFGVATGMNIGNK